METLSYSEILLFELDDLRCALDVASVIEVVRAVSVRTVPGQPPFVAGVIDVRGTLVPVLDLRARLGRTARGIELSDRFIILAARVPDGRRCRVALWVDAVLDVVSFDPETIVGATGLFVGERSLSGVMRTGSGLVMIHDPDAFINESEADALAAAGIVA